MRLIFVALAIAWSFATSSAVFAKQSEASRLEALGRAQSAMNALIHAYFAPAEGMFKNRFPVNDVGSNYWWQANAIDVLAEGVQLKLDVPCAQIINDLYEAIIVRGALTTTYNDDRNWMALALLHAYKVTGRREYLATAQQLFDLVYQSWQPSGGIVWNDSGSSYRNTAANAPAAILGASLYMATRNRDDLLRAQQIYHWEWVHLVSRHGTVWDGVQGNSVQTSQYSYNSGVVIGAAVRLWQATGDETYLRDAELVGSRSISEFAWLNTGLIQSEGQGDGGLFNGIYVRYLELLTRFGPLHSRRYFGHIISVNAQNAWLHDRTAQGLFAQDWTSPVNLVSADSIDLSTALSGVFLMNQDARIHDSPT